MALSLKSKKNLETQGFQCDAPEFAAIEPWLRFNPAICFSVAALGLYLFSPTILFTLALIAAIGAFFPHSVGDIIYNYGFKLFLKTPALPPNPAPRRFACFVGSAWALSIAFLFLYGYVISGYVLGVIFLLVVIPMMFWHYCVASLIYQKFIGYIRPAA